MAFRTATVRSVPRAFTSFNAVPYRSSLGKNVFKVNLSSLSKPARSPRVSALAVYQPTPKALTRYAHTNIMSVKQAREHEAVLAKEKLPAYPELVSTESSIHNVNSEIGTPEPERDVDMMAGIRSDFETIKETFTLREVPREALMVGLAGVIPYLITSLSTVYLSFDIQYAALHGQGLLMSGETAEQLLHIIEPIQLGYGASIISFLGAIHWGLEWAGYGGYQGYPRYSIGIIATAVAWPTILFSAETGLIAQFLVFTFLYYADARASTRGWAPPWYSTYRFVLTFVVGASIVASLVGRGQISDLITRPTGAAQRMRALTQSDTEELERDEAEAREKAQQEGNEEEEEEDE